MSEWYLYRDDFQGESSLGGNPRETNISIGDPQWSLCDESALYIVRALEFGMDPDMDVCLLYHKDEEGRVLCDEHECLASAVLFDGKLLERCLEAGLDVNRKYPVDSDKKLMTLADYVATWKNESYKDKVLAILKKYGAATL